MLEGFFDLMLGWVNYFGKPWNVIIISFIVTLLITAAYKFLTNQALMKELKAKMKDLQKQMKQHKIGSDEHQKVQKEFMPLQFQYMRHSWKPMLYTFLPLILIFNWMRATFNSGADVINWKISLPLFGTGLGWLGTYIVSSIIFSMILRKIMKVH